MLLAELEEAPAPVATIERFGTLRLLGSFHLEVDGRSVDLPAAVQRLLALLAVRRPPVGRGVVAGVLWADVREDRAGANLRTALWRCGQAAPGLVEATTTHLQLHPMVVVDLHEASIAARSLLSGDRFLTSGDARRMLDLLRTDLLHDWCEEWVLLEREHFRQLRLHALEALCERLILDGDHASAIEAGIVAVAGEPLRESAQRALVRAHLAEGNRGEALRQYRSYQALVRAELGVDPSPQLSELVEDLHPVAMGGRDEPPDVQLVS